jgi:hypothetical protein
MAAFYNENVTGGHMSAKLARELFTSASLSNERSTT